MKKVITTIVACLVLALSVSVQGNNDVNVPDIVPVISDNGLTLSMLFMDNTTVDGYADNLMRLGYRYGVFEGFVGTDTDFDILEYGFKAFSRNIAQEDAVWGLSKLLANYINAEDMEIRGYAGAHRVEIKNLDDFSGAILGILQKEIGSPMSINAEVQLNDGRSVLYYLGLSLKY